MDIKEAVNSKLTKNFDGEYMIEVKDGKIRLNGDTHIDVMKINIADARISNGKDLEITCILTVENFGDKFEVSSNGDVSFK